MPRLFPICVVLLTLVLAVRIDRVWADEKEPALSPKAAKFFESKIRPVLIKECYSCHSQDAEEIGGKLLLDTRQGMLKGGESGPLWMDNDPQKSLLVQALNHQDIEMPPEGPLNEAVVNDFIKWIKMGAPDPRVKKADSKPDAAVEEKEASTLWSLQPVADPPTPPVSDLTWANDPIDAFILARIEAAGLQPAKDASPAQLARRLFADLIGLAPTYEQVRAFEIAHQENQRQATRELVDQLLASEQFGVRWGRHWLDVARYAESNGNDGLSRNASFPHAWRYRDYVIDAVNNDIPYDQFLREQIAGDLLPTKDPKERDRLLVATGFLAIGSKPAKAMNNNFEMDVVDDQINIIGSGVMGLSVACARCHDHKHDPIPTKDYYALAGIFKSTETLYGAAAFEKLTAPLTSLHELKTAPATQPTDDELALQKELMKHINNAPTKPKYKRGTPLAMGVRDAAKPVDCKINIKGESRSLGPVAPRGFLTAVVMPGKPKPIPAKSSGRLELVDWLTQPEHPLTARVMANRVWLKLMGGGIVVTPNDFGRYGKAPTHPQLLDHLATRFIKQQWSVKQLIRSIVLSRSYQLSCQAPPETFEADPDNRLYARRRLQRLDSESFRDQMLQATGELSLQPATGSIIQHLDILVNKAGNLHQPQKHRSVYLCMLRNSPPPELAAFDPPDPAKVTDFRRQTTLPSQALFLLNSSFVVQQSERLAQLLLDSNAKTDQERIDELWKRTFRRLPRPPEVVGAKQLLYEIRQAGGDQESPPDVNQPNPEFHAWSTLSQALLISNEFRYTE